MRPLLKVASLATVTLLTASVGFLPVVQGGVSAQTTQDRKAEGDRLFQQGIQQYQTNQYEAALNSWEQALVIYRSLHDLPSGVDTLNNLGLAYLSLSQYEKAIGYFQQALPIYQQINEKNGEAAALNNLGLAYLSLSQYEKAIGYYQQALPIYQQINEKNGEAKALMNLGIAYDYLSQYEKAIGYYQQALPIFQQIKKKNGEAWALNSLGIAYDYLSQYEKAIDYFQQALPIFQQIKKKNGEAWALNNLGNAYTSLSQYEKAISYYQQALTIFQQVNEKNGEAAALMNLGNAHTSLSQYEKAIGYYQQALPIFQQIKNKNGEAKVLGNLGNAYLSLFQYEKAIGYYQQALPIFQQIKNKNGEASALNSLGNAYTSLSQYEKAIGYYQQALPIFQQIKNKNGEANALMDLGIAYDSLSQHEKAISYLQHALPIYQQVKNRDGEATTLNNLGLSFYKLGNFVTAETQLFTSIDLWESIRSDSGTDQNKVSIFESQARTYRTLQQVLVAHNKLQAALEVSERGRARAFVELLASRLATRNSTRSAKQIIEPPAMEKPSIAQIQQIAQVHNATLVQYSLVSNQDLYIWVIHPNGTIDFRQVDLRQTKTPLTELVTDSRSALGARSGDADVRVSLTPQEIAAQQAKQTHNLRLLHQLLIEPIANLLPSDPNQRVIFIPQGPLFLVPFPALTDANGTALIEQHTPLTAPSIQVLALTHQQKQLRSREADTGKALVVGNPTMPKVQLQVGGNAIQLSSLTGAEQEAAQIATLLKTTALTRSQAKKSAVMQQMTNARIIHLATHGLLDDVKGLGVPGAIALAPDGTGTTNDGLLTANEILDMQLKADLVVLSACDTGRGMITGDGVIGLSRSLISAGVPSIVVSLWKVPDDSTRFLMTQFYHNLQTTPDKAKALRQAMLTTKQKYPKPLDWAAFTLIGEAK